jgi:hypothetical protein
MTEMKIRREPDIDHKRTLKNELNPALTAGGVAIGRALISKFLATPPVR